MEEFKDTGTDFENSGFLSSWLAGFQSAPALLPEHSCTPLPHSDDAMSLMTNKCLFSSPRDSSPDSRDHSFLSLVPQTSGRARRISSGEGINEYLGIHLQ